MRVSWSLIILALVMVINPFIRMIKFLPDVPNELYYGTFFLFGFIEYIKYGFKNLNGYSFVFLLFCAVSILLNNIHPSFRAPERYMGLCAIVFCVGPLFFNAYADEFKVTALNCTLWICVLVSLLSFGLYLVAPAMALTERASLYGGITVHSMVMGPVAALATIFIIYILCSEWRRLSLLRKCVFSVALAISMINCLMAGSRSALAALMAAILVFLWFFFSDKRRIFWQIALVMSVVIVATTPIWWKYTETIQNKMEYSESKGDVFYSRQVRWQDRISEIKQEPILGIGFASQKKVFGDSGQVEPGNGWLFVWSSCGIVAMFSFLMLIVRLLRILLKSKTSQSILVVALLTFFALHLNAEGYVISSGAPMCFILWLTLGAGYSIANLKLYRK